MFFLCLHRIVFWDEQQNNFFFIIKLFKTSLQSDFFTIPHYVLNIFMQKQNIYSKNLQGSFIAS